MELGRRALGRIERKGPTGSRHGTWFHAPEDHIVPRQDAVLQRQLSYLTFKCRIIQVEELENSKMLNTNYGAHVSINGKVDQVEAERSIQGIPNPSQLSATA